MVSVGHLEGEELSHRKKMGVGLCKEHTRTFILSGTLELHSARRQTCGSCLPQADCYAIQA
jgi:hypothetical protein